MALVYCMNQNAKCHLVLIWCKVAKVPWLFKLNKNITFLQMLIIFLTFGMHSALIMELTMNFTIGVNKTRQNKPTCEGCAKTKLPWQAYNSHISCSLILVIVYECSSTSGGAIKIL